MEKEKFSHVELKGDGNLATLILNGVDLSNYVSEVTYHKKAGELATLELDFTYLGSISIRDIVIPKVPDDVAAALKGSELNG